MVGAQMWNASANVLCHAGTLISGTTLSNDFAMHVIFMISEGESGEGRHIKLLLCGGL